MAQYLKPDSAMGYVEDNAEIESLKFNNLRHSVLGCMLGDFNEVGEYVVSHEIVDELIHMEKYIVQTYDNIELCKSVLKLDKQISFMVTFEGNKATLSLVEKLNYEANFAINSGTYSNINEYVLDLVETSGEINRNVIYERWNIKPFGGNIVDIFNCDESILEKYLGVVNRFKYLLEANKILLNKEEELEEAEACYSNDILEILKHYPKLEQEVIKTIKETLSEKKEAVSVKKPNFAKTFNEVFENAVQQNIGVLEEKEKEAFEQEKRNAIVNLNIKREDLIDVEYKQEIQDKNQINPNVVILKVAPITQSRTINELGEEFVAEEKFVQEKLNKQDNGGKSELDKLKSNLQNFGFGEMLDITKNENNKAASKEETYVQKSGDKKLPPKKAEATKPASKKAEVKKPAAQKPAIKPSAKPAKKENANKQQAPAANGTQPINRILSRCLNAAEKTNKDIETPKSQEADRKVKRTYIVDVKRDVVNTDGLQPQKIIAKNTGKTFVSTETIAVLKKDGTTIELNSQTDFVGNELDNGM